MDERLEKALEFGNYRQTLANRQKEIKSRMSVLQAFQYNQGSFVADHTLIGFVNGLIAAGKKSTIILDSRDKPIEIADLSEFFEIAVGAYTEASNEYKELIAALNKSRNVKQIMDW